LNQTKLSIKEIQQVWRAVKDVTRSRSKVSQSALEIARKAGWDDRISEIETRVRTAIATLEDSGYLKRGQNVPRIFATSILAKNAKEAIERINASPRFDNEQKTLAARIIVNLISNRSIKRASDEEAESRVDYIADHLGIVLSRVIEIVNLLREEKILANTTDLTAFFRRGESKNRALNLLESYRTIEEFLLSVLDDEEKVFNVKKLNEQAEQSGCRNVNPDRIKTVLNFLAMKDRIRKHNEDYEKNHIVVTCLRSRKALQEETAQRNELAKFILEYLIDKSRVNMLDELREKENTPVEFSVIELKEVFENRPSLLKTAVSSRNVEDALFYLSRIEALSIEGGFMVVYNALSIERIELDNKRQYKAEDYKKLQQFYENKIQQIHIVGEYARKVIEDYKGALQFVDDYFQLNYSLFLSKYFKGSRRDEITRNITPAKFGQLFGTLSPRQLAIIKDSQSQYIVVTAGPGSGKTRIIVHKMASLLLMEDVKHEQLLMLTFSRSAATEFQKRLIELIGTAAYYIQIKTFHSYCFDLLGRVGTIEKSDEILREAVERIKSGEVGPEKITKTVLVIDEAQDMNADEFSLIKALMEHNPEMRVIAVGDDDQNIFEFRGATSECLEKLISEDGATKYELLENYRSRSNLVDFANQFVKRIRHRMKVSPIIAVHHENGRIKIVQHRSGNLVTPVVNDILKESLPGTVCILTKTNDEASQIAGLLLRNRVQAKLIQSNEGFNLLDLLEVRFFLNQLNLGEEVYSISEDAWDRAKQRLEKRFAGSPNLEASANLIRDFETTNPKSKYKSDLEIFIRESKLEDFIGNNGETVFVSTIHKAKGREFDNVILVLDQFAVGTDEECRQIYVAATRAKRQLIIHYNGNYLDSISTERLERVVDNNVYSTPSFLAIQLTHEDVWLDYFSNLQGPISELTSGDKLNADLDTCRNSKGLQVVRFSRKFVTQVQAKKQNGYTPKVAKVRFIVYWKSKEPDSSEIKIVLPELHFERALQQVPNPNLGTS
jgi:ATP-dependent DNA helicase RecQ